MSKYRTALGRSVDMAALAAKNEHVRAVGNQKVNARGDTIDSNGKVIKSVNSKVNSGYAKTVGNRSANAKDANRTMVADTPPPKPAVKDPIDETLFTPPDMDVTTEAEEKEIEALKAAEAAKVVAKPRATKTHGKKNDTTK